MPSAPLDPRGRPSGAASPVSERHLRVLRKAAKAARARLRPGDADLAERAARTERQLRAAESRAGEARADIQRRHDADARCRPVPAEPPEPELRRGADGVLRGRRD